jgi:hypothetical protein
MKKRIATAFCTLTLCSLLLITVGTAMAAEPGYERTSYLTQVTPTIDGVWTSPDEWTDGNQTWIGTDVVFTSTLDSDTTRWIIEFLTDTTDDPDDYLLFCIYTRASFGYRFKITGHTNIEWYIGDQSGGGNWIVTDVIPENEIEWANSLSTSPTSSTPHWILEFQKKKTDGQIQIPEVWDFLIQVYDASNPGAGTPSWPPTNPNYTVDYGVENYSPEPIPEGLTFGIMALLSTVSVLIGYRYLVKRKETKAE